MSSCESSVTVDESERDNKKLAVQYSAGGLIGRGASEGTGADKATLLLEMCLDVEVLVVLSVSVLLVLIVILKLLAMPQVRYLQRTGAVAYPLATATGLAGTGVA